jgi:hypothetical protein
MSDSKDLLRISSVLHKKLIKLRVDKDSAEE